MVYQSRRRTKSTNLASVIPILEDSGHRHASGLRVGRSFCKIVTSGCSRILPPTEHAGSTPSALVLYSGFDMQAIQILTTGPADVLTLRDLPTPTPGPGEALIRIEASGVNFIDTYFREGRYPAKLPYTLGQEAAGIVVAVASDVTTVKAGDHVAWCGIPGTYAQLAVAPAERLVPIPKGVTSPPAAGALIQGI